MMRCLCLVLMVFLAGCVQRSQLAPVVELKWQPKNGSQATHIVRRGETLYSIAFRYDRDFRALAGYNHIPKPYTVRVGQAIRIPYIRSNSTADYRPTPHRVAKLKPLQQAKQPYRKPYVAAYKNPPLLSSGHWIWPAKGKVVANFFPEQGKKGIDIAGKKGEVVYAAAGGVVAYSGSGLSGYGNLIIIKHDGQFLTAYGNNLRNRVTEGQQVKVGQIIADMGIVDRKFWGVHFEIRKAGQPVNPLSYLQRQSLG